MNQLWAALGLVIAVFVSCLVSFIAGFNAGHNAAELEEIDRQDAAGAQYAKDARNLVAQPLDEHVSVLWGPEKLAAGSADSGAASGPSTSDREPSGPQPA